MTDDLAAAVAALDARVCRLEAEREILAAVIRYGFGVDATDGTAAAATFTPDGVYDGDHGFLEGRAAIAAVVDGEARAHRRDRTAHLAGPLVVSFADDSHATVVGHTSVMFRSADGLEVSRVSSNRWEMVATDEGWKCARRVLRPIGDAEASALVAVSAPDAVARATS